MPVADFFCTKCQREETNHFYRVSTLEENQIQCPNCQEIGGMEIRHNSAPGLTTQPQRDVWSQTPKSFKEVLGAIKGGVAPGKIGTTFEKY